MTNANQEERRQVLLNDKVTRDGSTLLDHAEAETKLGGGRFAHLSKPTVIKSGPDYFPASGPWSGERAPEEPPLDFSVDDCK